MNDKLAITQQVLAMLAQSTEYRQLDFNKVLSLWWMNVKPNGGVRLTKKGYQAFVDCGLIYYTFSMPIGLQITAKFLLLLDRKLDCPYYIELTKRPQIILFGKEQAVLFALYGNLEQWMQFLSRK